MIFKETRLKICDNSGAKVVLCIGFFKSIKCRFVGINNLIRVCVKKLNRRKFFTPKGKSKSKVVKRIRFDKQSGERLVYRALIITSSRLWKRDDGCYVGTKTNRAVLISDTWKFLGTRIYGPVTKELRKQRFVPFFKELCSYAKRRL